jgi:hypothetical protein
MIAANLSKACWSLGWVSALDCEGRTLWIVDAHRDNGKRFVAPIAAALSDTRHGTERQNVASVLFASGRKADAKRH